MLQLPATAATCSISCLVSSTWPKPDARRLGDQRPILRLASPTALEPYCATCQRRLDPAQHRGRAAQHVIELSRLELELMDLEVCVADELMLRKHRKPPEPELAQEHPRMILPAAAVAPRPRRNSPPRI